MGISFGVGDGVRIGVGTGEGVDDEISGEVGIIIFCFGFFDLVVTRTNVRTTNSRSLIRDKDLVSIILLELKLDRNICTHPLE